MVHVLTASSTTLVARILQAGLVVSAVFFLCLLPAKIATAATYGSGNYSETCYSADCSTNPDSPSPTEEAAGTPNTGLQHQPMFWAALVGTLGFVLVGTVLIRLTHARHNK